MRSPAPKRPPSTGPGSLFPSIAFVRKSICPVLDPELSRKSRPELPEKAHSVTHSDSGLCSGVFLSGSRPGQPWSSLSGMAGSQVPHSSAWQASFPLLLSEKNTGLPRPHLPPRSFRNSSDLPTSPDPFTFQTSGSRPSSSQSRWETP